MEKCIFELDFKVRDYECDLQGIVNNANYLHYFEHTRHEFLDTININVLELHNQGVDPVIARVNMALKAPLTSGDEFVSKLYITKEGIKYAFHQDLFRKEDNRVVAKAVIEAVCLVHGKLTHSELFDNAFAPYIK
ncbi:thioesterase superfamily protein [Bacteroides coprosuis DSM 18011]|uniref:Thioesterase superfamily protein n=1 Tax=Bacteroides coprosuis DSM 18011 TaxID=679937 RepID=F3ZR69_9BACE|nr:acyl-CoA thioesterase [Bacteroides coprosuis]EGJ70662.1 thioesterase superfamily protein [Bacteroides coprosuis DSM 18011]